jgi:hypothetical protein
MFRCRGERRVSPSTAFETAIPARETSLIDTSEDSPYPTGLEYPYTSPD